MLPGLVVKVKLEQNVRKGIILAVYDACRASVDISGRIITVHASLLEKVIPKPKSLVLITGGRLAGKEATLLRVDLTNKTAEILTRDDNKCTVQLSCVCKLKETTQF